MQKQYVRLIEGFAADNQQGYDEVAAANPASAGLDGGHRATDGGSN
jgi:hypothetical protein